MDDRERWDQKYRDGLGARRKEPDPFVLRALELIEGPPGRALDLATGTGRHALELAGQGWRTSAWDVSPVALEILAARARERDVEVDTRALDLLDPALAFMERFDLVSAVDFLDRPLWERLRELVSPGGHLIVRTFTRAWPGPKPPPIYRLEPDELAAGLPGFETLLFEESGGRAGLLGRRR